MVSFAVGVVVGILGTIVAGAVIIVCNSDKFDF